MIRSHFAARLATTLIIGFMISLMSSSCKTNYISTLPPVATQPSAHVARVVWSPNTMCPVLPWQHYH